MPRPPVAFIATICCTALLLPVLAVLQYRWIGEVSRAGRERMQQELRRNVDGFRLDFEGEVLRVLRSPGRPQDAARETPQLLLEHWSHAVANPRVVREAFLISRQGGPPETGSSKAGKTDFLRYDPQTGAVSAVPEPANLRRLLDGLHRGPAADVHLPAVAIPAGIRPGGFGAGRNGGPERLPWRNRFGGPPPWRDGGGPRFRGGPPPEFLEHRPPPREGGFGLLRSPPLERWLVVVYNLKYLGETLVPELLKQHFGDDGSYAVRIDGPDGKIFQTASAPDSLFQHVDADGPMFRIPGRPDDSGEPANSIWRIRVTRRQGTLDDVVKSAQRRDLAVSALVFLLLGASIATLVVLSRRTARLAAMQMEFVAGVSHELRTPLAVMNSAADNLAEGIVPGESVRKYGELILRESRRLAKMVDDVLAFSGLERTRRLQHSVPVDAGRVIAGAIAAYAMEIGQSGCVVESEIANDLPAIQGDPAALEQCVRNLIGNAVKYGKAGGWVGVRALAEKGGVAITVEDRGPGIDAEELRHVFEPFFRGCKALEAQTPGSGIGLSVVKRIAEAHGGSVTVESEPGQGCRFTLHLPKAPANAPASAGASA